MGNIPNSALPPCSAARIASFLRSSQARAALCLCRQEPHWVGAVYDALALVLCAAPDAALRGSSASLARSTRDRAKAAFEVVVSRNGDRREAFWAAQRLVCESCYIRPSCTRRPCQRCGRPGKAPPPPGLDLCCTCAAGLLTSEDVAGRLQQMQQAAEAWASRSASSLEPLTLPDDPGHDCAGLTVNRAHFEAKESDFWKAVGAARAYRYRYAAKVWMAEGRIDPSVVEACYDWELLSDSSSKEGLFQKLAWCVLSAKREEWRAVKTGREADFFRVEEELRAQAERAVRVLTKLERLGTRDVRTAAFSGQRRLKKPTIRLDATSQVLCGEPVSNLKLHIPSKLLARTALRAVKTFGFPALHDAEAAAAALHDRLRWSRHGAKFAALACEQVPEGLSAGFTYAELFCADPQALLHIAGLAPEPDAMADAVQERMPGTKRQRLANGLPEPLEVPQLLRDFASHPGLPAAAVRLSQARAERLAEWRRMLKDPEGSDASEVPRRGMGPKKDWGVWGRRRKPLFMMRPKRRNRQRVHAFSARKPGQRGQPPPGSGPRRVANLATLLG